MQGNRKPIYIVSELGRALYQIEHVGLRDHFFSEPESIIAMLLTENGFFGFVDFVLTKNGIKNPYRASDFSVNGIKIDEDSSMIRIEFPEPEFSPLVYRMYLTFNKSFTKKEIYTIEAAADGGAFLCKWSGQDHTNIHRVAEPSREKQHGIMQVIEIKIISDLFLEAKG
ncbi:MAG: hypothetical protein K5697_05805 [Lachnospiraceae bacterium]|nr:hypothetical protein [Lachnospiraceae bacterium]